MALSGGERGRKVDPAIQRLTESNAQRQKGHAPIRAVEKWGSSYSDLGRTPRKIERSPHAETAAAQLSDLVGEMTPAAPTTEKISFDALFNSVLDDAAEDVHAFNALHDPGSKEHREELYRRYRKQPAEQSSARQKQKPDTEDEEFDYEEWAANEEARFGDDGLEEFADVTNMNEDTAEPGPMPWESWSNETEEDTDE